MTNSKKYSVIIPVFNRPNEVDELLESLSKNEFKDFEVIVVEDGSAVKCDAVVDKYKDSLDIKYFEKENGGPGQARNFGAGKADGQWLIILDSDVIVPAGYFEAIEEELINTPDTDAFGGPDREHDSFTDIQKAISYSMTSFFTTGGIRGGKKKMDKFYPRSFNMGIRKSVFNSIGGFSKMRFGEDIDLSIRVFQHGYSGRLFPKAFVWHKRRTDFGKFFKQVFNSGIARINLYKKYPESLKIVHTLPACFTIGMAILCLILFRHSWPLGLIGLYAIILFVDSFTKHRKSSGIQQTLNIAALSVAAAFVQLIGYGSGFIFAWWERCLLGRDELEAFKDSFYQ